MYMHFMIGAKEENEDEVMRQGGLWRSGGLRVGGVHEDTTIAKQQLGWGIFIN